MKMLAMAVALVACAGPSTSTTIVYELSANDAGHPAADAAHAPGVDGAPEVDAGEVLDADGGIGCSAVTTTPLGSNGAAESSCTCVANAGSVAGYSSATMCSPAVLPGPAFCCSSASGCRCQAWGCSTVPGPAECSDAYAGSSLTMATGAVCCADEGNGGACECFPADYQCPAGVVQVPQCDLAHVLPFACGTLLLVPSCNG